MATSILEKVEIKDGISKKNANTLVALALLVADSKPDQRALIIQLIQ